jgi:hypothetical protein
VGERTEGRAGDRAGLAHRRPQRHRRRLPGRRARRPGLYVAEGEGGGLRLGLQRGLRGSEDPSKLERRPT